MAEKETQISRLIKIAKGLVGRPYKYGAKMKDAPSFFDCSLFTQYVFKQIGVDLPRSTILQADNGIEASLEDIKPGDLLFFHGERGFYNKKFPEGIGHVVLYAGDGKAVHAASERIQENPEVVERGEVEEKGLDYIIDKCGPLIVVKRIIK
ncbi:MAG: C40 family peptidase [Candidatus Giovannonibacteria bacterium]|nr:MAG: C40 family peptidase [Candidatus Giovannonibacteria bacterium]